MPSDPRAGSDPAGVLLGASGLSPKRNPLLRRMNLARRALRRAAGGGTTVTDIATRFGFRQFGRFALENRALFGETLSATLRGAADIRSAEIA
jgi:hypothetical protein